MYEEKRKVVQLTGMLLVGDSSRILNGCWYPPIKVPISWLQKKGGFRSGTMRATPSVCDMLGRLLRAHSRVLPYRGPRNGGGHAATHEVFTIHEQRLWLDSHPPGGSRERFVASSHSSTYITAMPYCIIVHLNAYSRKLLTCLLSSLLDFWWLSLTCLPQFCLL